MMNSYSHWGLHEGSDAEGTAAPRTQGTKARGPQTSIKATYQIPSWCGVNYPILIQVDSEAWIPRSIKSIYEPGT